MPGAGNYYMIQAAFPLAYLTARSIVVLAEVSGTATLVAVAVGTLNLFVTLPAGDRSLQRWGAGLPSLVDGIVRPDQSRIVARQIAEQLRPGEIVLLDSWRAQARQVPYWLQRSSGYGYLIEMSPQTADRLLQREGSNRVAFIVFSGSSEFATLKRPEWAQTWSLIEMNFELLDRASTPDWYVYRRKD
jgi:hypothetical protein